MKSQIDDLIITAGIVRIWNQLDLKVSSGAVRLPPERMEILVCRGMAHFRPHSGACYSLTSTRVHGILVCRGRSHFSPHSGACYFLAGGYLVVSQGQQASSQVIDFEPVWGADCQDLIRFEPVGKQKPGQEVLLQAGWVQEPVWGQLLIKPGQGIGMKPEYFSWPRAFLSFFSASQDVVNLAEHCSRQKSIIVGFGF